MDFLKEPWAHQRVAVAKSFEWRDVALLWEVGTGKSGATINILRGRYAANKRLLRTLIFAPPVVLKNWQKEFTMWSRIPAHQIVVLRGTGAKRVHQLKEAVYNDDSEVYNKNCIILTNYEAINNKEIHKLLTLWEPEVVVCDEAHRLKDFKSKRANAVVKLSDKTLHNYILTGTPILNSAMDLFMPYRILDRGDTFGKNFYAFRGMYFEDENSGMPAHVHFPKWMPRPGTYEEFNKRVYRRGLRAVKSECLDLPPLIKTIREVEMNDEQKRMYSQMRDDFLTYIKTEEDSGKPRAVVAQLAITKALRLQQIISGFAKDEHGEIHALSDVPRISVLRELLTELTGQGHKVIVWSVFKENYKQIRTVCEECGLGFAELHGEIPLKEKERAVDLFQKDPNCKVMIGNQASGGVGINLVEAAYAIYFSKNFSLEQDIQSEGRNYRGGSEVHEKITRIDLVCPGTIDELVNEALRQKKNIGDLILDWRKDL